MSGQDDKHKTPFLGVDERMASLFYELKEEIKHNAARGRLGMDLLDQEIALYWENEGEERDVNWEAIMNGTEISDVLEAMFEKTVDLKRIILEAMQCVWNHSMTHEQADEETAYKALVNKYREELEDGAVEDSEEDSEEDSDEDSEPDKRMKGLFVSPKEEEEEN